MEPIGLEPRARAHPDKPAIVAEDRRVTFAELDARTNRVARALRSSGIKPGDRIGCALKNRIEFFEVTFGAARAGAELVPISWRAKDDEVSYLLKDSRAGLLVAEEGVRAEIPVLHFGDEYDAALRAETDERLPDAPPIAPPSIRFYTSGTTGRPKAVERARSTVDRYLAAAREHLGIFNVEQPGEVHLCCGPLYHSAPLGFSDYALLMGQTVVLMERFDPEEFLRAIDAERATWSMMVPIHFVRLLALPEDVRAGYDISSMRRIIHAAAPCPPEVKRGMIEMFGDDVVWEFYGMTEGRATVITSNEWLRKPGSVGRPMPGARVKIMDGNGAELAPGETGLIYVSTGGKFEYADAPDKTAEVWNGDFFSVGDMGFLDDDGYLFLTDRHQDMIISGGSNVYPAEVEAVLHQHPAVADVAVIGIPDAEWGEAVKAIVEAHAPVGADELIEFCRARLAHYKCPKTVDLVEQLPREPNGKVRKRDLRAPYWEGRPTKI
ncbi:MAG TPA: AMP-binding protein [Actinomycetota bacterium]|nr:AMP-binding protein [Actinomycetota bacterium]